MKRTPINYFVYAGFEIFDIQALFFEPDTIKTRL